MTLLRVASPTSPRRVQLDPSRDQDRARNATAPSMGQYPTRATRGCEAGARLRPGLRGLARVAVYLLCACLLAAAPGCGVLPGASPSPFRNLTPIPLDGKTRTLRANVAALGPLDAGIVVRLEVASPRAQAVLLLRADQAEPDEATLVGGGPANTAFDYRVQLSGHYFVFFQFDPTTDTSEMRADFTVAPGNAGATLPAVQYVRVLFADDFLTEPGLLDPVDGTADDRALLESFAPLVRDGIVDRLRTIFSGTPVVILGPDDAAPPGPIAELTYLPDRVEADDQSIVDAALPAPDPTRPQCQTRVVFGEVLPAGQLLDPGNRTLDDQAAVFVGSFQGRGEECWTSAVSSVGSMILTLAQTGAHEIGHLVGLYHVEQVDLMNRSATLAFLRELDFARGQIQLERVFGGVVIGEVYPAIIQDPEVYFSAVFAAAMPPD